MTEAERREIDDLKRRVLELERIAREMPNDLRQLDTKFREELKSVTAAVERFLAQAVTHSIRHELAPYLEKLQHIESVSALAVRIPELFLLLESNHRELSKVNARAEAAAEAERRAERVAVAEEAREKRRRDNLEVMRVERASKRTHRVAVWGVLGSIVVAVITTAGACAVSHMKPSAPAGAQP